MGAGTAVACVIGCAELIIVAILAGVTLYLLVNADGTVTYQGNATGNYAFDPETGLPLYEPVPNTTPVPRPTPRTAPNPAPTTPEPGGEGEWMDPERINFSQRNISPNDYAGLMRAGLWNCPGTPLRAMDRGGQLVSYDNRRLDAAREIGDPARIERVYPDEPGPQGRTWKENFKKRFGDKRNDPDSGCVPDTGLHERPRKK